VSPIRYKRDMGRWNGLVGAHLVLLDPTVPMWLPLSFLRWLSHPIFSLLALRQDPPPFPGTDAAFGSFMLIYANIMRLAVASI